MATWFDDFEVDLGNWANDAVNDDLDWDRDASGTPSSGTGPTDGAFGTAWFLYLEASNGSSGNTAYLLGPTMSGVGGLLEFWYHMYGATMGTLAVDYYDGTWHELWSLSGQQQSSNDEAYRMARVPVPTGATQLRFRAVRGSSFTGDMAIDRVLIVESDTGVFGTAFPTKVLAGGNVQTGSSGTVLLNKYDIPAWMDGAKVTKVGARFYNSSGTYFNVKPIVVDSSLDIVTNGVGNEADVLGVGNADLDFSTPPTLTGGQSFYIGVIMETDGTAGVQLELALTGYRDTSNDYDSPASLGSVGEIGALQLYFEYEFDSVDLEQESFQFFDDDDVVAREPTTISQAGSTVKGTLSAAGATNVSLPGSLQEGDMVVVALGCSGGFSKTEGILDTSWTRVVTDEMIDFNHDLYYKFMGATRDTDVDITRDSTYYSNYIIQAWRGVDTDKPFDNDKQFTGLSQYKERDTSGGTLYTPDVPVRTPGSLVLLVGSLDDDDDTVSSYPSGYSATAYQNTGQASTTLGETLMVASKIVSSVGDETPGPFVTATGDDIWEVRGVVLRPIASGLTRTAVAAVDTGITALADGEKQYGLHIRINNLGDAYASGFKLQYKHVEGTNTWTDIGAASDVLRVAASTNITHGDDCPEYLGGQMPAIIENNSQLDTSASFTPVEVLHVSNALELHVSLILQPADVDNGDTVQVRVVRADGTALDTYTATPEMTVLEPIDDSRDAEVHGQASDSDERDAEATGSVDASSSRDAETSGIDTDSDSRDAEVYGSETSDDSRDAEAHGSAGASSSRDAEAHGTADADDSRDAEATGSVTVDSSRDAEMHGVDTTLSGRSAEATGSETADDSRDAETHGSVADSDSRDAETHGVDTDDDSRSAEATGSISPSSSRNSEVHGVSTSSSSRDAEATGSVTTDDSRDAEVHGVDTDSDSRAAVATGSVSDDDSRAAEASGEGTSDDSRSAEVHGVDTSDDSRDAEMTGGIAADDERSAETSGIDTSGDGRDSEVHGSEPAASSRASEVHGGDGADSSRPSEVHGVDTDSDDRPAEVHGQDTSASGRDAEAHGSDTDSDSRPAEAHGQQEISSYRPAEAHGQDTSGSSRPAETHGKDDSDDSRRSEAHGKESASAGRQAKTHGSATASAGRQAEAHGKDDAQSYRQAEAHGKDSASSGRGCSIHGRSSTRPLRKTSLYSRRSSTRVVLRMGGSRESIKVGLKSGPEISL